MGLATAGAAALLVGMTGCGTGSEDAVTARAMDFYRALGSGAADRACAALAPEARSSLEEQEEERCADVILDQDLPRVSGGPKVEVYGSMAQARFAGETAFLSRFDDGWRLTAVGCAPTVGDVPHRCRIEVG